MEFIVNRSDLLAELSMIQGAVAKKATIPILANVALKWDKGSLDVMATDTEVMFRCPCPVKTDSKGAATLPAKKLYDIVNALPDGEIRFKFGENQSITAMSGRSRYKMAGLPFNDFPALPSPKKAEFSLSCAVLSGLIKRVLVALPGTDGGSNYTLNAALLIMKARTAEMVSTDGHRMLHVKCGIEEGVKKEREIMIPKRVAVELLRLTSEYPEGTVEIETDANHIFCRVGERLLIGRQLTGGFPQWKNIIPGDRNEKRFKVDTDVIAEAVKRVALVADGAIRNVNFDLDDDNLTLSARNAEIGEGSEVLEISYLHGKVRVSMNFRYLGDFLSAVGSDEIEFRLNSAETPVEIATPNGAEFECCYVVMPIRI